MMTKSNSSQLGKMDFALCRSALYEAFALGFRFPTQETIARLNTEEQVLALAEIASLLQDTWVQDKENTFASQIRQLVRCPDAKDVETLQNVYRYLFGHTARSKVPLYETEYGEETVFQQPHQLGDISGFFNAFGLRLNISAHERIDHISCQCEFLCFLTRKEAYALEKNDTSMVEETRKAQRLFLKDHLGRFTPSFSKLLNREDPNGFYGKLGSLCCDFVLNECVYFNIPAGSESLRLRSSLMIDESFTCGGGEEAIQLIDPSSIPSMDEIK